MKEMLKIESYWSRLKWPKTQMGTFSFEKAPIPQIVNHSWQKAPNYSYYNRSISLPIRRLTLHETRIRF